jgi:hypothetical protein
MRVFLSLLFAKVDAVRPRLRRSQGLSAAFAPKQKTNSILALTAPTLAPRHPSLRCVFPRVHRYLLLSRCRSSERQKPPTRRNTGLKMLVTSKGKTESTQELVSASIQVLIDALESGHSEVLASYLKAMAKFHHYSFGNILLIATQKPTATHVAGIRSWNLLGRRVKRGEKGIMIFAPMLGRTRKESQQTDSKDAESTVSLVGFRPVYVWDVLQSEGKELPQLDSEVKGDVGSSLARLVNFTIQQGIKFGYSDNIAPARGMSYGGAIRILPNLSEAETIVNARA